MPVSVAIAAADVSKQFGERTAVKRVSFEVEEGEFFALLGPNGAGKSTLINMLSGLTRPSSGRLSVAGFDVVRQWRQARSCLGVVPQELIFDPFFTVREALFFQAGYYGCGKKAGDWIEELLEVLSLRPLAHLNTRFLSGGMKRRLLVAQALVHRPAVVLLDEPTAGVDLALRRGLWAFLRRLNKEGKTILLTTHYLEEAETLCGRVAMMKKGKLVALESTSELLERFGKKIMRLRLRPLPSPIPEGSKLSDGVLEVPIEDYATVERALAGFRAQGLEILDLEIERAGLEEVFLSLVGEE